MTKWFTVLCSPHGWSWVQAPNLHQCLQTHLHVYVSKRLRCHTDLYTVSRCHTRGESEDHTGEKVCKRSTLALKPRADITKSPKRGNQWPHEKVYCPPKLKKRTCYILRSAPHFYQRSRFSGFGVFPFHFMSRKSSLFKHSASNALAAAIIEFSVKCCSLQFQCQSALFTTEIFWRLIISASLVFGICMSIVFPNIETEYVETNDFSGRTNVCDFVFEFATFCVPRKFIRFGTLPILHF